MGRRRNKNRRNKKGGHNAIQIANERVEVKIVGNFGRWQCGGCGSQNYTDEYFITGPRPVPPACWRCGRRWRVVAIADTTKAGNIAYYLIGVGAVSPSPTVEVKKKEEKKKRKKKVQPDVRVKVGLPTGGEAQLRSDGKLWKEGGSCGAKALVQMRDEEVMVGLNGDREGVELEAELLEEPDPEEWKVPQVTLTRWASVLLSFDTEAMCIYGKHRKTGKWLAVVPEQECSAAGVDVDDFSAAIERLVSGGYRRVGTIHTHPGFGTFASGIDTGEMWDEFGGVHIILNRKGDAKYYYSTGTVTWPLGTKDGWKATSLWKGKIKPDEERRSCVGLVTEVGRKDVGEVVKKRTFVQTQVTQAKGVGKNTQKTESVGLVGGYSGYNSTYVLCNTMQEVVQQMKERYTFTQGEKNAVDWLEMMVAKLGIAAEGADKTILKLRLKAAGERNWKFWEGLKELSDELLRVREILVGVTVKGGV